jgi:hypothetical protein
MYEPSILAVLEYEVVLVPELSVLLVTKVGSTESTEDTSM